jgi:hypothetical protein
MIKDNQIQYRHSLHNNNQHQIEYMEWMLKHLDSSSYSSSRLTSNNNNNSINLINQWNQTNKMIEIVCIRVRRMNKVIYHCQVKEFNKMNNKMNR